MRLLQGFFISKSLFIAGSVVIFIVVNKLHDPPTFSDRLIFVSVYNQSNLYRF